jgi:O-antigen/teichoic acid export membrane protein
VLALAPDFVRLVFGSKWHAAGPVLQILAPIALAQTLTGLNFGVLQAIGLPELLFRYTVVASVITIAAFAVGLIWGLTGVATAYLIVSAGLQPAFVLLTSRALGSPPRNWVRSVSGILQAGLGMLAVLLAVRSALLGTSLSLAVRFALCVAAGALVYALLVLWRAPEIKNELRILRERRRRPAAATEPQAAGVTGPGV